MTFFEFTTTVSGWLPEIKRIAMYHFGDISAAQFKADNSPVTLADKAIEAYLVAQIKELFPSHSILGEESGEHQGSGDEYTWIIDPIDGTQSFMHGVPLFSSLIALTKRGEPHFGAIYLPATGDIMFGDNNTALLNGREVKMSDIDSIEEATILSSSVSNIFKLRDGERFTKVMTSCRCFRTWGDGFGYYMLLAGLGHAMVDPKMAAWDFMPIIPIVRGAGGIITDYYGGDPTKGNAIVAASPSLHGKLISEL